MQTINSSGVGQPVVLTPAGALPVALSGGGGITIGTVDIDQTTPGTSNGVVVNNTSAIPVTSAASGIAANSPSNSTTTAYAASAVVKASAGVLYGFAGYNSLSSGQYILFYDSTTVPGDGGQAVLVIWVPASANFSYDPGIYGRKFVNGIAWSNSSTAPTKTIGSASCFLDAQFV